MSIKPVSLEQLEKVPGVLGKISRERYADYQNVRVSKVKETALRASFKAALSQSGLSIIAEVKRSSPSQGAIANLDPVEAALSYEAGGAAAISVLTEPRYFGGKLKHLEKVSQAVSLPCLRKDFTVHPQQVIEAKAAGASAVLLIVAVLREETASYLKFAQSFGLDVLVEVHDRAELAIALKAGADIIGVNNRNLQTLEIDLNNAPSLIKEAKDSGFQGLLVAESGYKTLDELRAIKTLADAVLIGTSLAGSGNLQEAVAKLKV
jgi:indole-3-glycerol phosphate synthase